MMFECMKCGEEMIWGGDSNTWDMDGIEYVVSHHTCNQCHTWLEYAEPQTEPSKEIVGHPV